MPYYEYTCPDCDLTTMALKPFQERDDSPNCVMCSNPMLRQYASPSIAFKGTGFYTTDKGKQ